MTDREKLMDLIAAARHCPHNDEDFNGCDECKWLPDEDCTAARIADHLLASGVTFATDTNDGSKWISMAERKPEDDLPANSKKKQIKVLTAIKGDNGYAVRSQMRMRNYYISRPEEWTWKYSAGEVTHWMPLPTPPKED